VTAARAQDCSIELTIGRRYGLLGSNGSGKSNFLQCLAAREARGLALLPHSSGLLPRVALGRAFLFFRRALLLTAL